MATTVFFLGSHPALSAAELAAYAARRGISASWDLSRLPVALLGQGDFHTPLSSPQASAVESPPAELQAQLGGTVMVGTLRATFTTLPGPDEVLEAVPEILQPRQGKRIIGLCGLPCSSEGKNIKGKGQDLVEDIRRLAMALKRNIGMKGTRVVFPPARRPDLSTAQLLHNDLPARGTAIFFLVAPERMDLVTIDAIQDIAAYAQRDRGRPQADPGRGMLPPKVAQMLLNLSLLPPGGTIYDPFCGVGTIPMEALLMGLKVIASDLSPKQVERTQENLAWLTTRYEARGPKPEARLQVFVHDLAKGAFPLPAGSVDAVVTEGWLGPPRTTAPLPREAGRVFADVQQVIGKLLPSMVAILKSESRIVLTVPAFRVGKRILRFPLEKLRHPGFAPDPLVPKDWDHPIFREATRGTLLYGRPDALVLREIVRFRKT